jgi:thiamine pyrophosphate-dependent acetolactate synthase large subunit-like protein
MDLEEEYRIILTLNDQEYKRFRQIFEAAHSENLSALKLLKRDIVEFMEIFGWIE